ncbi:unnamed protein product [Gadus morhua 'NCC']
MNLPVSRSDTTLLCRAAFQQSIPERDNNTEEEGGQRGCQDPQHQQPCSDRAPALAPVGTKRAGARVEPSRSTRGGGGGVSSEVEPPLMLLLLDTMQQPAAINQSAVTGETPLV